MGSGERKDEWLVSTNNEGYAVAMALSGAIAGCGSAKFSGHAVVASMVIDVDEIETDSPRRDLEENLSYLSGENFVNGVFKLFVANGCKLLKDAITAGFIR